MDRLIFSGFSAAGTAALPARRVEMANARARTSTPLWVVNIIGGGMYFRAVLFLRIVSPEWGLGGRETFAKAARYGMGGV